MNAARTSSYSGIRKRVTHGRVRYIDHAQLVGCDKQRAGTPDYRHGVPALALVTPYKFTNWHAVVTCGN